MTLQQCSDGCRAENLNEIDQASDWCLNFRKRIAACADYVRPRACAGLRVRCAGPGTPAAHVDRCALSSRASCAQEKKLTEIRDVMETFEIAAPTAAIELNDTILDYIKRTVRWPARPTAARMSLPVHRRVG